MYNAVAVQTNDKVAVDVDDYVALQMASDELKNILEIIFESAKISYNDKDLEITEDTELMGYLKIVEKRLYNGTFDRLKKEKSQEVEHEH